MSGHLNRRRRLLLRHPAYASTGDEPNGHHPAGESLAGGISRPACSVAGDQTTGGFKTHWKPQPVLENRSLLNPVPGFETRSRLQQQFRKAVEVPAGVVLRITSTPGDVVIQQPIEQATLLIGRDPTADLQLDDRQIARAQVALQWCAGGLVVINLNGSSVVRLGGRPVQCAWWRPVEELQVGPYTIRVEGWSAPALPSEVPPAEPQSRCLDFQDELQPLALRMRDRAGTTRDWPANRRVTLVGRASWCRMSVQDPAFAKVQSVLVRTRGGLWLVGLDADDWPIVNQRRTPLAQLDPGDRWSLGEYELELTKTVSPSTPEVAPPAETAREELATAVPKSDLAKVDLAAGLRDWIVAARLRCQELQLSCDELDLRRDELQLRRAELQAQLKLLEQLTELSQAGGLPHAEVRREQLLLVQEWLHCEPQSQSLQQFLRDLELELSVAVV